MNLQECKEKYGSVEIFGREIIILQMPYISMDWYESTGEDEDGYNYIIRWQISDRFAEDE